MFLNKINVNKLDNIKYFVFCSGKTGSRTLFGGMKNKFGSNSVIHLHSTAHFKGGHPKHGDVKKLITENSKKFDKIYIIDSYREPFERGISSFFQNIDKHCPNWRSMSVDEVINFFNENNLYLLDIYHSYHESWGYFNIPIDVSFDFEKGYIIREHENMVFVKTRLKEAHRWNQIFSEVFGSDINFNYENDSSDKDYFTLYSEFKQKYKLPQEIKNNFLSILESDLNDLDRTTSFYTTWSEMKKFMTETEIGNYLKKWIY
jgi:hypothetical protein